jgi:type IV pilus assembly protein PilW
MVMNAPVFTFLMRRACGMTILELAVTMALSSLLILGLIQIVSAATASNRLQENQAQIQENARMAMNTLSAAIRQAGFSPEPWNDLYTVAGLADNSLDAVSTNSDRLSIRSWSDLNCFNNRNPVIDSSGNSLFFIRESVFDLSGGNNLTHLCRYGPSLSDFTTQIRRQGFIPGVESFQVLYGEDPDRDGGIERWVRAGRWDDPGRILGVKIGLLLSGNDAVTRPETKDYSVLDTEIRKRADGKLRRVFQFTTAIRSRTE